MRRGTVGALVVIVVLFGGSFLDAGWKICGNRLSLGAPPHHMTVVRDLRGAEARSAIKEFAKSHPGYQKNLDASEFRKRGQHISDADAGYAFVEAKLTYGPRTGIARLIERIFPRLNAQNSYSDGNGYISVTPWDTPSGRTDGTWYLWSSGFQDYLGFDMSLDTNYDDIGYPIWISGDRGGLYEKPDRRVTNQQPEAWLARLHQAAWPTVEAACACGSLCRGSLGNCLIQEGLGNARMTCAGGVRACRGATFGYFACVADVCGFSVYAGTLYAFWDYGNTCGWMNPCAGPI